MLILNKGWRVSPASSTVHQPLWEWHPAVDLHSTEVPAHFSGRKTARSFQDDFFFHPAMLRLLRANFYEAAL